MARAPKLRFVQSFSAGKDGLAEDKALFAKRARRLANAQGVNKRGGGTC